MNSISSGTCCFCDQITNVINYVGVIAGTPCHDIGTRTTIKDVIACIAGDGVVSTITCAIHCNSASKDKIFKV